MAVIGLMQVEFTGNQIVKFIILDLLVVGIAFGSMVHEYDLI